MGFWNLFGAKIDLVDSISLINIFYIATCTSFAIKITSLWVFFWITWKIRWLENALFGVTIIRFVYVIIGIMVIQIIKVVSSSVLVMIEIGITFLLARPEVCLIIRWWSFCGKWDLDCNFGLSNYGCLNSDWMDCVESSKKFDNSLDLDVTASTFLTYSLIVCSFTEKQWI